MARRSTTVVTAGLGLLLTLGIMISVDAQESPAPVPAGSGCEIDLNRVGQMRDILSNALVRGLSEEESRVRKFLDRARGDCEGGADLLRKTADEFGLTVVKLRAEVERWRHVNCEHGKGGEDARPPRPPTAPAGPADERPVNEFAENVTLHVVLHELGHALVREFDLPVLANEETLADAFATHYLTAHMPDRALEVLRDRVESLLFEAREVPRERWTVRGEHNNDARRAHQISALAIAVDAEKYAPLARAVGMTAEDVRRARDYGSEIHRSWRRMLRPLLMPAGTPSSEARMSFGEPGPVVAWLHSSRLATELESVVRSFDWHSRVTIRFAEGDGGAGWSRAKRTVTVHGEYVLRFVAQGESIRKSQSRRTR